MADIIRGWCFRSFAQPGFAHFWRMWNPFIGFWLLKLYRLLGGDRRRPFACLVTFAFAGFCHDLVGFLLDPPDGIGLDLTIAFIFWGILVLAMSPRKAQRLLRKIPASAHVALNLLWLLLGLLLGASST